MYQLFRRIRKGLEFSYHHPRKFHSLWLEYHHSKLQDSIRRKLN